MRKLMGLALCVGLTTLLASSAGAVTAVAAGSCDDGGTVEFLNIATGTNGNGTEWGPGECSGNLLDYDPTNEFAADIDPLTLFPTQFDGQLNFTVQAKAGQTIQQIILSENGDYFLNDIIVPPDASVRADMVWSVTLITPAGGTDGPNTETTGTLTGPQNATTAWGLGAIIDLDAIFGAGTSDIATRVDVVLDNSLIAVGFVDDTARIVKKDWNATVVTVPEPTTAALVSLGLLGLVWQGRRRND